jgi:ligand-binding SRPBCC domain-containing protein
MPVFQASSIITAPVITVANFHRESKALKKLTPPPVFVQLHAVEPLGEGSIADFTLWFGPFPVHWLARHSQVNWESGFTDTQIRGPLQSWVHTHRWTILDDQQTLLEDRVVYEHHPGWRGQLTRLLFPCSN